VSSRSSAWRLWPAALVALLPVALPALLAAPGGPVILYPRPVLCQPFPPPPPPLVILAPAFRPIRFEVWLPADAQLWISGTRMSVAGEVRAFQTAPVAVGCDYGYTLTATCGDQTVTWNVLLRHSDPAQVFDMRSAFAKSGACQRIPVGVDTPSATYRLSEWKFLLGTEPLTWLNTHEAYRQDFECHRENVSGGKQEEPEAIALRGGDRLYYARGVQTYLPLNRVAGVEYPDGKKTVKVYWLPAGRPASIDKTALASGTTAYREINKVKLEGRVEKDTPALTFLGGYPEAGAALAIRGIRFPIPREAAVLPEGARGTVRYAAGPAHATAEVTDLLPIYRRGSRGKELRTALFFDERLELEVSRVRSMHRPDRKVGAGVAAVGVGGQPPPGLGVGSLALALTLGALNADTAGEDRWYVRTWKGDLDGPRRLLLSAGHKGEHVTLEGFVGRARLLGQKGDRLQGGYWFFPTDIVTEVRFHLTEPVAAP
jgi:hypothetical protein